MVSTEFLISDTFAIAPSNPDVLYYNHLGDFYSSHDGGATWTMIDRSPNPTLRDRSILVDIEDQNRIYAIEKDAVLGPLSISGDGGYTWTRHDQHGTFWNIAQSRQNPELLYAVNSSNVLMKSIDRGTTWQATNLTAAGASPPSGYWQRTAKVAVAPQNDQVVYVSYYWNKHIPEPNFEWLDYGVIVKTSDGGETSEVIYEGRGNLFLTVAPTDADIVYAGSITGPTIRTTDGGINWEEVSTGTVTQVSGPSAIDPYDADTVFITNYTDMSWPFESPDWESNLLKSNDGGQTWSEAETGLPSTAFLYEIWADPSTPNTYYALDIISGIYKTVDGGASWYPSRYGIHISTNLLDCAPTGSAVFTACGGMRSDALKPMGGAFRSYAHAEDWVSTTNLGLASPMLSDLAVAPSNPDMLYASSQSIGQMKAGVFLSEDAGVTWELAIPPPGMSWEEGDIGSTGIGVSDIAIAPSNNNVLYAVVRAGNYYGDRKTRVFRSDNAGASWQFRGEVPLLWYWNTAEVIAVDSEDVNVLYFSYRTSPEYNSGPRQVLKSTDGGASWQQLSVDPDLLSFIETDPSKPGLVYIGGRAQDPENPGTYVPYPALYRSDDWGANWDMLVPDITYDGYEKPVFTCICINPDNPDMLYGTVGEYTRYIIGPSTLLMSPDRGETWKRLDTAGIQDLRVLDMACSRDYLYLATNDGVFRARISDYSRAFSASAQEEQRLITTSGDQLLIPPGSLAEDTDITLSIMTSEDLPEPPEGMAKIARAFDFGPDGIEFLQPVILVFTYEDAEVPPGMSEEDLVVYYYDSLATCWMPLMGDVNPEENTITCWVDHFTTFAIMVADTQHPQVAITSPAAGSTIEGIVPFSANASDNVKLWKVEFYLDGALLEVDTVVPFVHSLDTSFITPGIHTLTAVAYDTAGLTASDSITVLVKTTRQPTDLSLEEPAPAQYSDSFTLRATLTDGAGRPVIGREVAFSVGDEHGAAMTGEDGCAKLTMRMTLPAGKHPEGLSASFAGDGAYLASADTAPLDVEKEKAVLSYNGAYLSMVDTSIDLRAELCEEEDGSPGDIGFAGEVGFDIYDSKGDLVRRVEIPVAESVPGTGVAEIATPPLPAGIYTVRTSLAMNNYYVAQGDVVTELAVYDPQGGFITGGGFIWDRALKTFAFVVKPSSCEPWLPKGNLMFVDHSELFKPLRISATGFAWLVIPAAEDIAYVAGTCTLGGQAGYNFYLTVEDSGCWFVPQDTIHLVVKDANGNIVYETQGIIDGGNIRVQHSS